MVTPNDKTIKSAADIFLFVHTCFVMQCCFYFFFFWTIGVVMADSVENILHVWSPLLWATSLPTKPGMGRQNDFERSHNASHIWCPWASRCVTVLNHSVWLRAESWELHAYMILSRHPCLLPQLWPPVARTRAGLWQNGTGLSSITSQVLDGKPSGVGHACFLSIFFFYLLLSAENDVWLDIQQQSFLIFLSTVTSLATYAQSLQNPNLCIVLGIL